MKRGLMDSIIACISLSICILSYVYMRDKTWLWCSAGLCFLIFVVLGIKGRNKVLFPRNSDIKPEGAVKELVLLSEENTELASWSLLDRSAMVIGRDIGENEVTVNLADVTYASFIDIEHAVLNYAAEQWYIEDLHSRNGVRLQKRGDIRQYKLASDKPCRVEVGDTIFIGETKLRVQ